MKILPSISSLFEILTIIPIFYVQNTREKGVSVFYRILFTEQLNIIFYLTLLHLQVTFIVIFFCVFCISFEECRNQMIIDRKKKQQAAAPCRSTFCAQLSCLFTLQFLWSYRLQSVWWGRSLTNICLSFASDFNLRIPINQTLASQNECAQLHCFSIVPPTSNRS